MHTLGLPLVGDGGVILPLSLLLCALLAFELVFECEQLLLVFLNLGGGGTCAGGVDDCISQPVVLVFGLAHHNLLDGEILEVVGGFGNVGERFLPLLFLLTRLFDGPLGLVGAHDI